MTSLLIRSILLCLNVCLYVHTHRHARNKKGREERRKKPRKGRKLKKKKKRKAQTLALILCFNRLRSLGSLRNHIFL